jgi:hypothetical protein
MAIRRRCRRLLSRCALRVCSKRLKPSRVWVNSNLRPLTVVCVPMHALCLALLTSTPTRSRAGWCTYAFGDLVQTLSVSWDTPSGVIVTKANTLLEVCLMRSQACSDLLYEASTRVLSRLKRHRIGVMRVFAFLWAHSSCEEDTRCHSRSDSVAVEALMAAAVAVARGTFCVPLRNGELLQSCLDHGFRVKVPETLMRLGFYQEPRRAFSLQASTRWLSQRIGKIRELSRPARE